jgi:hypothetical protein
MALKRLDEEFDLKAGTQLLPYMKRLLPSLEGRFQEIEADQDVVNKLAAEIRAAALMRMNEILIPATEDIIAVTKLGFLLAPVSTPTTLTLGYMTLVVDEGAQRETFTPSPYLIIEHTPDDYAIARLVGYHKDDGLLEVTVTAIHGNPGPWSDWMVSSTPGMADSTKLYHDSIAPMHDTVVADTAEVISLHAEIIAAAQALAESGLDAYAFIRRDGAVPFEAIQIGFAPPAGSNDAYIPTTAWTRARIQEYVAPYLNKGGGTMVGALTLARAPVGNMEAATKAYVDGIIGQGGVMLGNLTVSTVNPTIILRSNNTGQYRSIASQAPNQAGRWHLFIGDNAAESGANVGSDFALHRYADNGAYLGQALYVNRASGYTNVNALNVAGNLTVTNGAINHANGDIATYRSNPATGVLFLNSARSAYHFWDGSVHSFVGGGGSFAGPLACGAITCASIYTQGYGITTWGITSHGDAYINGNIWGTNNLRLGGGTPYSEIEMYDNDWGPMWLHHNGDTIGFLNNGRGWCFYATNAGHIWTPQYGWIHDYVNNTAWNIAWYTANTKFAEALNTFVRDNRLAHAGDWWSAWYVNGIVEPTGGSSLTGWSSDGAGTLNQFRTRYNQINFNGNWYTISYV